LGDEGVYISPRSLKALQNAESADIAKSSGLHLETSISILGKHVGVDYHKFVFEQSPVTFEDLIQDEKKAINKLKVYSDSDSYRGDMVDITIQSLIEAYPEKANDDLVFKVAKIVPKDQAVNLLKDCFAKRKSSDTSLTFDKFMDFDVAFKKSLKERISRK
jgi:hypothetical protein